MSRLTAKPKTISCSTGGTNKHDAHSGLSQCLAKFFDDDDSNSFPHKIGVRCQTIVSSLRLREIRLRCFGPLTRPLATLSPQTWRGSSSKLAYASLLPTFRVAPMKTIVQ